MKFSESVIARLPKREIPASIYNVDARHRYNRRGEYEFTGSINKQEIERSRDILQTLGFVIVRDILTRSATTMAKNRSLANKSTVNALQQAWNRMRPDAATDDPVMSIIANEPGGWRRFDQPGLHMIVPSEGREAVYVTQRWRRAEDIIGPGDALVWTQEESFFPEVIVQNPLRNYIGAFILHENVMYDDPPVALGPPLVSQ